MRKNFRLIAAVIVMITVNFGTFAQSETHKDVILDGKPAKLNLKTGEVKKVSKKENDRKKLDQDSTKLKTEIQANLITNETLTKTSNSKNVIVTSKPDTLAKYYKDVLRKEEQLKTDPMAIAKDSITSKSAIMDDVILIKPPKPDQITANEDATASVNYASNDYSANTTNYHIVQKGETLYALARMYDTTLGQLKHANNLETTLIMIGQKLRVRNFDTVEASGVWVVSRGDTLYSIARKNNTTVASLKALNGLTGDLIFPGQKIQL